MSPFGSASFPVPALEPSPWVRYAGCCAHRRDYRAGHAIPQSPDELCNYQIILSGCLNAAAEIRFASNGRVFTVRSKPRLIVNDIASLVEAAVSGFGIAQFISHQIGAELAAGSLQVVLDEYQLSPLPVNIVHNEGRAAPAKIRTLIDL